MSTLGRRITLNVFYCIMFAAALSMSSCGGGNEGSPGGKPGDTTHSVSGIASSGDLGLPGVLLTLSGAATGTALSDSEGNYVFAGLENGSYTVTPSKKGFAFTPADIILDVDGSDVTGLIFTAVPLTYSISGTVTQTGAAFPGVLLTLSGAATGTMTTDSQGKYLFQNAAMGSYTVTPSMAGFSFSPAAVTVVVNESNETLQNFAAAAITYSISGKVTTAGLAFPGVTVALKSSGNQTVMTAETDSSGNYRFSGISNGSYTVTPFRSGYIFTPGSASATVSGKNIIGQDFTGGPITAATRLIPDTGQTACYDSAGRVISCMGTGQDGAYAINAPSYTDNSDGTVTDNVTGLVWQKRDDGTPRTWDDANAYCSGNVPGLPGAGWRLATSAELNTIVDYGRYQPAINSTYFPYTQKYGIYWSATPHAGDPLSAWYQIFEFGFVLYDYKTAAYYVRCVR